MTPRLESNTELARMPSRLRRRIKTDSEQEGSGCNLSGCLQVTCQCKPYQSDCSFSDFIALPYSRYKEIQLARSNKNCIGRKYSNHRGYSLNFKLNHGVKYFIYKVSQADLVVLKCFASVSFEQQCYNITRCSGIATCRQLWT